MQKPAHPVISLDTLPAHGQAQYLEQWLADRKRHLSFLPYDEWLEARLHLGATLGPAVRYQQGRLVFQLQHGAWYHITDAVRGERMFRCMIVGETPFVAFVSADSGTRYPWLCVPGLFTIEEIVTMRQIRK